MISRSFRRQGIALLCLVITIAACRQSPKPGEGQATICDTSLTREYRQVKEKPADPVVQAAAIRDFFHHVPQNCRRLVATDLAKDLFDIVYTNHATDTIILPFFLELSETEGLTETQQGKALLGIPGYYLYAKMQPDSAERYLNMAAKKWPKMNDTVSKSYHSLMGQYLVMRADLKGAGDHYLKTIALCEKLKDSSGMAGNYANYGTVFSKMGEYAKSIAMKQKAVAFFEAKQIYNSLLIGYVGIGVEYGYLHRYDSAMLYYQKAVLLTEKGIRNPNVEFDLYISMAGISLGENRFDTARYFYSKINDVIDLSRDKNRQQVFVMASTPAFAGVRNVDKEMNQIRSYVPGFFAENNLNDARDAFYTLYHTYYIQHRYEEALHHYEIYDSLKSELARAENKQYVAEMETKYETQKKELKIQVQQKEIRQTNILNGFLLASLATLGLGAAFIITRVQLRRKKKEAVLQQQFTRLLINNTEEERGRIAKDLHDGISQELMLLKRQINTNQEHTNDRIDAIINEIRMISRDLHPVMLDKIGLKLSVEHICAQMMEHNLLFITADIDYDSSLDKAGELQLFRMIQEALNNVVKYAGAQAARVTIKESTTFVRTEIIDNGKGFDVAAALNSKTSFGLLNLRERSKSLGGKTEISSSESGTVVMIEIPKKHV